MVQGKRADAAMTRPAKAKRKAAKATVDSRPVGRPSTYDPAYCDQVIACLADGHSLAGFAGLIKVSRATVYTWMQQHPEFLDAVKIGQAAATYWWEVEHKRITTTGKGNITGSIFALKNRSHEDWKDRIEHTGKDGGPIQTVDLTNLSDADLTKLAAILGKNTVSSGD